MSVRGSVVEVNWSEAERRSWAMPERMTVSEWADKNRILDPKISAESGPWHTDRTPYLRGIMDAFCDPLCTEITVMAGSQLGKTEGGILNCLAYAIDQDPGPALVVQPTKNDARSFSDDRVRPMIDLCPVLASHKPRIEDDMTKIEYKLDNMFVWFAWAHSAAALAAKPIRYVFLDEIDKYPAFTGREADPVKLAVERTRTYWNRKIVKVSTPTTRDGYIFKELQDSDQRKYFLACPECGKYQSLKWPQVKFPEDVRDYKTILRDNLAWYECESCRYQWNDVDKIRAMRRGVWVPEGGRISKQGRVTGVDLHQPHQGFWLPGFYSPWLSWADMAAEWLRSHKEVNQLMNFINSWLAEIWEEKIEETDVETIRLLSQDYPHGTVPAKAIILVGGVDVQQDHFYLVIRGWGLGEESWLIRAARLESWEQVLDTLLFTEYPVLGKVSETRAVRLVGVDSRYKTDEVYTVCRAHRDRLRPIAGFQHQQVPFYPVRVDRKPSSGQPIRGGLLRWNIDTSFFKDKVARIVAGGKEIPGKWHNFKNVPEIYLEQFTAEHKVIERTGRSHVRREVWKTVTRDAANHFWDAEIMAVAIANMLYVQTLREPGGVLTYRPEGTQGPYPMPKRLQQDWIRRRADHWTRDR